VRPAGDANANATVALMKRERDGTAVLQAPLIGREEDLSVLLPHVAAAASGSGSAIVLVGEGGVGKTRLAEAVAEEAQRQGFRVAAGRAFAVESGMPYALFSDAFMPVVRGLDPAARATLARGAESELAVVLPALGGPPARAQSDDPSELRSRLLWVVAEFVRALAAKQPLLLLLDDVHWADLSSLELVHFLARQAAQARLLIVCTYNEQERGQRPELRLLEQSLLASGIARVHRVQPLTQRDTDELLRRVFDLDDAVTNEFSAVLYGWTRGNVLFVRETLRTLVESGRLHRREDGQWLGWDFAELELPGSIREVILTRLERLGPAARAVADLAAAIGTRCDHALLRASSNLSEDVLLSGIDELRRLQLIHETSDVEVRYDFAHPLVRQALYAELGVARARMLHASIAHALEHRYEASAVAHADELAFHFARADAAVLGPKALQYLYAAGSHALARCADREAVDYLRLALERWTADSVVPRESIMNELARAHQRLGEYDAAIRLWQLALSGTAATAQEARAALHRRLGQAYYWSGRYTDALEQYQTGVRLIERAGGSPMEAALRLAAGVCLQELGRADEAKREIEKARGIAETAGDVNLLARTHRALLLLHIWVGPPDEARTHGARAVALARDARDAYTEFFSEWGLAVLEGLTGHTTAMAEHIAATERIAEQQRSPLLRLWTAELVVELSAAVGDWEDAIATGDGAIRLARSLNQRTLLPRLLVWTSLVYLGRGELPRAKSYIDEAWEMSGAERAADGSVDVHTVVPAHIGLAAYLMVKREFVEAIRVCQRGLEIADRTGYAFWAMHRLLPILAEAHCHLWDVEGALAVERRIRQEAERLGHRVGLAWADTCRALVVWIAGDPAGATRLIREACAALEAIPMLPDAARLRRQLAGRLAETGDRAGALVELRRVHDMFARMGAESELAKARGMFREIGAKPPARTVTSGAEGLTGREIEIAQMVADRKSNKAIGRVLDISPRTVSTHLSNIFRKLDVASRGELADYVRRHGIG
jgi:DNA-binding CsgD family transcriptional regulator